MTSLRKRLAERRERNRQLAIEDSKNRCRICRRALVDGSVTGLLSGERFCSSDCLDEATEQERANEAR